MNKTVKRRIDIHADAYGWDSFYQGRDIYQKDGYEVYLFSKDDGFELTVRNPESMERETVLEVRDDDICTTSPAYVAILEHVLMKAENICSREQ